MPANRPSHLRVRFGSNMPIPNYLCGLHLLLDLGGWLSQSISHVIFFSSHVYLLSIQQGVLETQRRSMGEENGSQAGESRGGQRKERLRLNAVPGYAIPLKTIIMMTKHFFSRSFVVCKEDQQQNQTWAQACSFSAHSL